jgi:hypothetical protein
LWCLVFYYEKNGQAVAVAAADFQYWKNQKLNFDKKKTDVKLPLKMLRDSRRRPKEEIQVNRVFLENPEKYNLGGKI